MLEEIDQALETYHKKWHELISSRQDKEFFERLKPVAVGWKVADEADYRQFYADIHDQCDKIVETFMNGRWIAKMHLKDEKLDAGIQIIKLMQRRPDSEDALGLDHVDFYCSDFEKAEQALGAEPDFKWTREDNDAVAGYEWLSVWFAGTEAKIKNGTVLDIVIQELKELNQKILNS